MGCNLLASKNANVCYVAFFKNNYAFLEAGQFPPLKSFIEILPFLHSVGSYLLVA